ncbi:helix-turn-helix domain-containing protein [Catenuloplanes japonicus]|uniref:helix-turn-helix domain-containing protein n=1 Tax=Catenuloplanes japonicus TaxID=33876 RepID=UPI00052719D0|nr:helix-turn-helix transcriptional regulator [Catenuloplanes japonicus]
MTLAPESPPLVETIRATRLPPPSECRAIRQRSGATLAEVAAEVGVDPMTISRWERGLNKPNRARAITYRHLLDALAAIGTG